MRTRKFALHGFGFWNEEPTSCLNSPSAIQHLKHIRCWTTKMSFSHRRTRQNSTWQQITKAHVVSSQLALRQNKNMRAQFFCGICQLRPRKTLLILNPKLLTAERLDLGNGVEDWIAVFFLRLPHTQSRATPVVFALDRDSNTPATQLCTK